MIFIDQGGSRAPSRDDIQRAFGTITCHRALERTIHLAAR
jgi:ribosomal protein L34E